MSVRNSKAFETLFTLGGSGGGPDAAEPDPLLWDMSVTPRSGPAPDTVCARSRRLEAGSFSLSDPGCEVWLLSAKNWGFESSRPEGVRGGVALLSGDLGWPPLPVDWRLGRRLERSMRWSSGPSSSSSMGPQLWRCFLESSSPREVEINRSWMKNGEDMFFVLLTEMFVENDATIVRLTTEKVQKG